MSNIETPLPVGIEQDSRPAFLYEDDLGVDTADPIYQQVAAALANDPRNAPLPAETPRPPEMKVGADGELIVQPSTPAAAPTIQTPPVAGDGQVPAADTGQPSSTVPPIATPTAETTGEPGAESGQPAPGQIEVDFNGEKYTLGQTEVDYLLQQNAWMQSIPDTLKAQWAGVQDGNLVTISPQELAALQAAAQAPVQPAVPAPTEPDLTYADPDIIAYIDNLKRAATPPAPAPGSQPTTDQQPDAFAMAQAARENAEREFRLRGEIAQATTQFTTDYSLTPAQAERLQQVTVSLGIVPSLSRDRAVYSPMGQLIREAPMGDVMKDAYEIAMNSDPDLKRIRDDRVFNERLAAQNTANQTVNNKKALAGSLASAPSAAVPASATAPLTIGPGNQMNLGATANAIAAFLTEDAKSGAGS